MLTALILGLLFTVASTALGGAAAVVVGILVTIGKLFLTSIQAGSKMNTKKLI